MLRSEQIKHLRILTQAGISDCSKALDEANGDVNKAVDIIKTKGKNIVSGREGIAAAEGVVEVIFSNSNNTIAMVEINCQTDFVARSNEFKSFASTVAQELLNSADAQRTFDPSLDSISTLKNNLIATTKENIVVRRWFIEQTNNPNVRLFCYSHTGNQLASIVTLHISSNNSELIHHSDITALGNNLAMQVVAMNPIAIDPNKILPLDVERQKSIFESQLLELKKPQSSWDKILKGKFNKWYAEVCLLNQEAVFESQQSVENVIQKLEKQLHVTIKVVNMLRCQVGEGIVKQSSNLAEEVAKLMS